MGAFICIADGCDKRAKQCDMCWGHYSRRRRHGDMHGGGTYKGALQKFIAAAVAYRGNECMIWPFGLHGAGYGDFSLSRGQQRSRLAHRVVCEKVHGKPPTPGHVAAHNCGNRPCVAPRHLRWATEEENKEDEYIHYAESRGWLPPGSFARMRGLDSYDPLADLACDSRPRRDES